MEYCALRKHGWLRLSLKLLNICTHNRPLYECGVTILMICEELGITSVEADEAGVADQAE